MPTKYHQGSTTSSIKKKQTFSTSLHKFIFSLFFSILLAYFFLLMTVGRGGGINFFAFAQSPPPPCQGNMDYYCGGTISALDILTDPADATHCICLCRPNFEGTWCERCKFGFTGSTCDQCLDGWYGWPNCIDNCTNTTSSCSGHAYNMSGSYGACSCNCQTGYNSSRCDGCSEGFSQYPNCVEACTSAMVSCSGHADYVEGLAPHCSCHCSTGYYGTKCDQCAPGFTDNYPTCIDECVNPDSSCNGHAVTVLGNPAPNCLCTCAPGYNGTRCERCVTGYAGYPNCYDDCSNTAVSCSNRGLTVKGNSAPNCLCTCTYAFEGSNCEKCIPERTGWPLCSTCAEGYTLYPYCVDACTDVGVSCGGHASSVVKVSGNCICSCVEGYIGSKCAACADGYDGYPNCTDTCKLISVSCNDHADYLTKNGDGSCNCGCRTGFAGAKCEKCGFGYVDYPNCVDNCTNPDVSCGGRAVSVTGIRPSCVCSCKKSYEGILCDRCSPGFTADGYPSCHDDCSSVYTSCNNRAIKVTKKISGIGCICNCTWGYAGDSCDKCAIGFAGNQCDHCAPGFYAYPFCQDSCTNATSSCNGRASDVGGVAPTCICRCLPGWAGDRCTYCARGYTGADCQLCSYGFTGYPFCTDTCTSIGVSCNNRAQQVSGQDGNCTCVCNRGWAGAMCEHCDSGYEGAFCDRCAPGYSGYPFCSDDCTLVTVSCGSRADSVVNFFGRCICSCESRYAGDHCDQCQAGYKDFPDCVDACSVPSVSCERNASSVSGIYPYCMCNCNSPWGGRLCEKCKFGFEGYNCDTCATGFYGPLCLDDCTNTTTSCGGRASSVIGFNGSCTCQCNAGFGGVRCDNCAEGYAGFPNCSLSCTASRCNYRALYVDGQFPNCTCQCLKQFAGSNCEECAPQYAGANCDMCAAGYIQYPNCRDGCSNVTVSCNNHATTVSGNWPFCKCQCKTGFAGLQCGSCQTPGYELYPFCTEDCTVLDISCNASNTYNVSGIGPNCYCHCKPGWAGVRCDKCEYGFSGENCTQCAVGFRENNVTYPNCNDNCTDVAISCNNRAFSPVTRDNTTGKCVCNCIHRFTGPRCTDCAKGFAGSECTECAAGFEEYPICRETCSHPSVSCNGNAIFVSGSYPDCVCTCKVGFVGLRCEMCASAYTGVRCGDCAAGYSGYPYCSDSCTNPVVSCSNRAYGVRKHTDGSCICDCYPQWGIPLCETCFKSYSGPTCNLCSNGYSGYPNCQDDCSNATVSCSGIGLNVTGSPTQCRCQCPFGFGGNRCERCADGFSGYPYCAEDCSNITISCMGRANYVYGKAPDCQCNCTYRFDGYRCSDCSFAFNGTFCDRCANGFRGFPNCIDDCTDPDISCLGHGIRVTGSLGNCICVCQTNFTGSRCNTCVEGYSGYPNCTDACRRPEVSCNGVGLSVTGSPNDNCTCVCPKNFAGLRCERCAEGYTNYPQCVDNCSSVNVSCSGNAAIVSGVWPYCKCDCFLGFGASNCSQCLPGFVSYPKCWNQCTNADASCNFHAMDISPSSSGCVCHCLANYTGESCDQCANGYGWPYPNCQDNCTNVNVSCSGHATRVSGSYPLCNCVCWPGWGGQQCERCAYGFAGSNCTECDVGYASLSGPCDVCATGYSGYPLCVEACNNPTVSCNGYAQSVTPTVPHDGTCNCLCYLGYTGARCERCLTGWTGYPNCQDMCTHTEFSCSGHAHSVVNDTSGGASSSPCQCACWQNFTGARCDACLSGFGPYPTCLDNCSDAMVSCHGHGTDVTQLGSLLVFPRNCSCTCAMGYAGQLCDECAVGYSGYPNCMDNCEYVSVSCSSRAFSVRNSTTSTGCQCSCFPGYTSQNCSRCDAGYGGFPRCLEDCSSVKVSCNTHADSVSGNPDNCDCICSRGYAGRRCDRCAPGFANYPTCHENCTLTSVSCSSLALSISSYFEVNATQPTCVCDCMHGTNGSRCERCSEGYGGWPKCVQSCSSPRISCNDHADVVNGSWPECQCYCLKRYDGLLCDRCAKGYAGYPVCYDDCTEVAVSCGLETGVAIIQRQPFCQCQCQRGFGGNQCTKCALSYEGYPHCVEDCSNATVSCNNHAYNSSLNITETIVPVPTIINVTRSFCNFTNGTISEGVCADEIANNGTSFNATVNITIFVNKTFYHIPNGTDKCQCACQQPKYTGNRCQQCASGYGAYPTCIDICTNVNVSCNGHGNSVSGSPGACQCQCKPEYQGRTCNQCSAGYTNYPYCIDACEDTKISCRGNATSVYGTTTPNCTCTCVRGFAGRLCELCASGFISISRPPFCIDNCSNVNTSCSAHGLSVEKKFGSNQLGNCSCHCQHNFDGEYCHRCAAGYDSYPYCIDNCSNTVVSCGGRATAVNTSSLRISGGSDGVSPPTCNCSCLPQFAGNRCQKCAVGYSGFPNCVPDCTSVAITCHNLATVLLWHNQSLSYNPNSARQNQTLMLAFYYNNSQVRYNLTKFFVTQAPLETSSTEAMGNGTNATTTPSPIETFWALQHDPSMPLTFRQSFPDEKETSSNQESASFFPSPASFFPVSFENRSCFCNCSDQYNGSQCEKCSRGFDGYPFCSDACAEVDISCHNRAYNVSKNNVTTSSASVHQGINGSYVCQCNCYQGYTGARCEKCFAGYSGFPNCIEDCTNMTTSCSGHADNIAGVAGNCICVCQAGFEGLRCQRCANGYQGYPNCQRIPTPAPGAPGYLTIQGRNVIDAKVIRTGKPFLDSTFVVVIHRDYFETALAQQQLRITQEKYMFSRCLAFIATDTKHPFGAWERRNTIWEELSVVDANSTMLELRFLADAEFEIPVEIGVWIEVQRECTVRSQIAPLAVNRVQITIVPEKIDQVEADATAGLLSTASIVGGFASSSSAIQDGQVLIVLGAMGCAKAQARGMVEYAFWLLSPFGFWGDRLARYLGVLIPFVAIPILHFLIAKFFYVVNDGKKRKGRRNGDDDDDDDVELFEEANVTPHRPYQAKVRRESRMNDSLENNYNRNHPAQSFAYFMFPGISLFLQKILLMGLTFHAIELFRLFDTASVLAGVIAGVIVLSFEAFLIFYFSLKSSRRLHHGLKFLRLNLDDLPKGAIASFIFAKRYLSPKKKARKFFPFLSELRSVRFAPFDPAVIIITAILAGIQPGEKVGCIIQYAILAFWFGLVAIAVALLRPYRTKFLNVTSVLSYICFCAVSVSSSVESFESGSFGASMVIASSVGIFILTALRAIVSIVFFYWEYKLLQEIRLRRRSFLEKRRKAQLLAKKQEQLKKNNRSSSSPFNILDSEQEEDSSELEDSEDTSSNSSEENSAGTRRDGDLLRKKKKKKKMHGKFSGRRRNKDDDDDGSSSMGSSSDSSDSEEAFLGRRSGSSRASFGKGNVPLDTSLPIFEEKDPKKRKFISSANEEERNNHSSGLLQAPLLAREKVDNSSRSYYREDVGGQKRNPLLFPSSSQQQQQPAAFLGRPQHSATPPQSTSGTSSSNWYGVHGPQHVPSPSRATEAERNTALWRTLLEDSDEYDTELHGSPGKLL